MKIRFMKICITYLILFICLIVFAQTKALKPKCVRTIISFPRGFVMSKVGPHQSYGFVAGKVFGESAGLSTENFLTCDKGQIDYIIAKSNKGNKTFIVFLNSQSQSIQTKLTWGEKGKLFKRITLKDRQGKILSTQELKAETSLTLKTYGLRDLVLV